eukprot:TRINITY_DN3384_c0_g1_i1.p2 TRINITY_DN3384_c0_g1~~TRINITY_DN3384_c0_g1_i1.p2  ORF type:complete len:140 (-),score=32.77 TRINITY_DN3384_c0_g1_i1:23-442(-)
MVSLEILFTWEPFLISISVGFLLNFTSLLVLVLLSALRIIRIITFEEVELKKKWGKEYDDYCKKVPQLFPAFDEKVLLQSFSEKSDWLAGFKGNYFFFPYLFSYALAFFSPGWFWIVFLLGAASLTTFFVLRNRKTMFQ